MKWGVWAVPAFAALLLAVVAACGGEDSFPDSFSQPSAGSPRSAPTAAPAATAAPAPTPAMRARRRRMAASAARSGRRLWRRAASSSTRRACRWWWTTWPTPSTASPTWPVGWAVGWSTPTGRPGTAGASPFACRPSRLDEAFLRVEALALEVESRAVTSEDVTDEYVDSQSQAGQPPGHGGTAPVVLGPGGEGGRRPACPEGRSPSCNSRSRAIQGRLNFLEQTAAFSLLEVNLKLTSADHNGRRGRRRRGTGGAGGAVPGVVQGAAGRRRGLVRLGLRRRELGDGRR